MSHQHVHAQHLLNYMFNDVFGNDDENRELPIRGLVSGKGREGHHVCILKQVAQLTQSFSLALHKVIYKS